MQTLLYCPNTVLIHLYLTSKILVLNFGGPGIRTTVRIPGPLRQNRGSRYSYLTESTDKIVRIPGPSEGLGIRTFFLFVLIPGPSGI